MTTFVIELVVIDNRFVNPKILGSNITRKTIRKGKARDDEAALYEAGLICGELKNPEIAQETVGKKYRTWTRTHTLHEETDFSSSLVVTFKSEL
jgi:hypothetical protein